MPRPVNNGEFAAFLKATGYRPRFAESILEHCNGPEPPPELIDRPVVYVGLEDARAFAERGRARLQSEWERPAAVDTLGDRFVFNEVVGTKASASPDSTAL